MVRSRTVLKCEWNQSFGSLLEKLDGLSEETIEKIENESFVDPAHVVPVDAPVNPHYSDNVREALVCTSPIESQY